MYGGSQTYPEHSFGEGVMMPQWLDLDIVYHGWEEASRLNGRLRDVISGDQKETMIELPLVNPIFQSEFDEQFSNPEPLDYPGSVEHPVAIVDIVPECTKTDAPLLIAPGFSEGPFTLESNMRYFSGWGRHVVSYDAPQGIGVSTETSGKEDSFGRFEAYEMGKAAAIIKVLEQKKFTQVDAVGHSEGCIDLVIAALQHPENFRNLVLVNPGGMVGKMSFFELIGRMWKHMASEREEIKKSAVIRSTKQKTAFEREINIARAPLLSIEAARSVACAQINDLLRILKQKGIGISIIHSVDDAIFPMDKVQKLAHEDQFDGFYSVKGGHNDFFLNPEPYSMLVDHALDALEAKQKNKEVASGATAESFADY